MDDIWGIERALWLEDAEPYKALCTSTCIRTEDGWRIARHQQTPL